jgi:hypothetical protein
MGDVTAQIRTEYLTVRLNTVTAMLARLVDWGTDCEIVDGKLKKLETNIFGDGTESTQHQGNKRVN